MNMDFVTILRNDFSISAKLIVGENFRKIHHAWMQAFFPNVKLNTGRWVYRGYRWHAYSFNHERAMSGEDAIAVYQAMPIQPFYLFHEWDNKLYECTSKTWPDLHTLNDDIYIFPHPLDWTFTITHEMSIGLGPYLAHAVNKSGA